jgi:transitional endoplasmic reticulum ATPase
MDGLLPRNHGYLAQHDIQLVEQALILISELEPAHNVFLIGTTNRIDNIDARILRGGRFSEKIEIGVPDAPGYRRLLVRCLGRTKLDDSLEADAIVERLAGVPPADLEAIVNSAKRMAMNRMKDDAQELPPLILDDFQEALSRVRVRF